MAEKEALDDINDALDKSVKEMEDQTQKNFTETTTSSSNSSTENNNGAEDGDRHASEASPQEPAADSQQPSEPAPENGNNPPPRPERAPDGVSHAYDDLAYGDFDTKTPQDKVSKSTEGKSKGSITPPERKRGGTSFDKSKGEDIMDVFWKDCILAFYAWGIDAIVDNTLDFAEWVLFAPFKSDDGAAVTTKTEKKAKTIYAMGEEVYTDRMKNFAKEKEKFGELNKNLEKEYNGVQPEWALWGRMPAFYPKLSQIYAKAKENPASDEAKFLHQYGLGVDDEVIKGRFNKEEKLFVLATRLATIGEVVSDSRDNISSAFSEKLKAVEEKIKEKDSNSTRLKTDLNEKLGALKDECGEDAVSKEVAAKIKEIKEFMDANNDSKKINKEVAQKVGEIRKISGKAANNEEIIKEHIRKNSQNIYQQLMENIDKIHETHKSDPEKIKQSIKDYLTSVNEAGKKAKTATDKLVEEGVKSKINTGKKRNEAKKAVENIDVAIKDFMINGEKLSSKQKAPNEDKFNLTEKQIAKAVEAYQMGR